MKTIDLRRDLMQAPSLDSRLRGNDRGDVRLRRTGSSGIPCSDRSHRGVQRGEAPLRFFSSPKIEDPPQAEWGIKGVEGSDKGNATGADGIPGGGLSLPYG